MISRRQAVWVAAVLTIVLAVAQPATAQMQTLQIVVKGGSLDKMDPSEVWSGVQYDAKVTVLDDNGQPVSGATVEFRAVGGAVSIDGDTSATTGNDGTATLSLTFTAGGIVRLFVDGSRVATLNILYSSSPGTALGIIAVLLLVLVVITAYTLYVGPLKWRREK